MLKCSKQICQIIFSVVAILSQQPEYSDRSEHKSKISGQCNKIATTEKNLPVRPSVFLVVAIKSQRPENSDKSEHTSKISGRCINQKKTCLSDRQIFSVCLSGDRFVGSWALRHCRSVCYGGRILAVLWPNL